MADVADFLLASLAFDVLHDGGEVDLSQMVKVNVPEVRTFFVAVLVVSAVLVISSVAKPDIIAFPEEANGRRSNFMDKPRIARLEERAHQ